MLLTANLSEPYWEGARKTACYLYNTAPSTHCERDPTSPFGKYFGVKPHVNNLRVFGSTCYPTNLVKNKGNHDAKAWKGIFVGYQDQQLIGWKIYLPSTNEFIITAHASFEDMKAKNIETIYTDEVNNLRRYVSDNCDSPALPLSDLGILYSDIKNERKHTRGC